MGERICTIDGCTSPHEAHGLCKSHYMASWRYGDPLQVQPRAQPPEQRFWAQVDRSGPLGCWLWTGFIASTGYGQMSIGGKTIQAHRFAYELLAASIPADEVIDHLCRVRHCVNPAHMEPVTNVGNVMRGVSPFAINARKTHCPCNHEYTPENTRIYRGSRNCRACARERQARKRAERKA